MKCNIKYLIRFHQLQIMITLFFTLSVIVARLIMLDAVIIFIFKEIV